MDEGIDAVLRSDSQGSKESTQEESVERRMSEMIYLLVVLSRHSELSDLRAPRAPLWAFRQCQACFGRASIHIPGTAEAVDAAVC